MKREEERRRRERMWSVTRISITIGTLMFQGSNKSRSNKQSRPSSAAYSQQVNNVLLILKKHIVYRSLPWLMSLTYNCDFYRTSRVRVEVYSELIHGGILPFPLPDHIQHHTHLLLSIQVWKRGRMQDTCFSRSSTLIFSTFVFLVWKRSRLLGEAWKWWMLYSGSISALRDATRPVLTSANVPPAGSIAPEYANTVSEGRIGIETWAAMESQEMVSSFRTLSHARRVRDEHS